MYPSLSGMPWLCRSLPVLRVLMVKQSETSGSATAAAGWLPNHLTVWRERSLIAAAPLYVKGHSYSCV